MPVAASAAETACVFPQPGGPYSSTPVRSRSGALPLSASSGAVGSVQLHAMRARKTECPTHGCLWCECQLQGCGPKHTSVKQGLWLQLQATPASLWPASAAQAEHQKPALDQGAPRTEAGKARGQRQRLAQRGHRVRQAAHVVPAARARRGAGVRARHLARRSTASACVLCYMGEPLHSHANSALLVRQSALNWCGTAA